MRRTKQVEKMVVEMNSFLERNRINDERDSHFAVFCHLLLSAGVYQGYNMFYFSKKDDESFLNKRLLGTFDPEIVSMNDAFLQVY